MRDAVRRFVQPTRDERTAQRGRDIWIVIVGAYVLLVFAYLWPPDIATSAGVPVEWAGFMIRVLQFHLGLLVALFAVFALIRRNWRATLAAVPVIVFTIGPGIWTYVDAPESRASSGPYTRLMTANLLVSNHEHAAMVREIKRARPDVLVLQEYSKAWDTALRPALKDDLPHSAYETREDSFGTALFANDDLPHGDETAPVLGSGDTPETRTVIHIGGHDVALYNIHLLPPIGMDYVREGHRQFDDLVNLVKHDELPVIVVGDLNLTETTPQHARLEDIGLRDAWDLQGRGRGTTWPNNSFLKYLPGLRLDHMYVSNEIAVIDVRVGDGRGSDHRPVIADLAMRK
jgi:endonuclease/exonuclease/phosphatase (EEP) superfamily protein YafD